MRFFSHIGLYVIFFLSHPLAFSIPMEQMVKDESHILVPQQTGWRWTPGDPLCVVHHEKEVACGSIILANSRKVIARMDTHSEGIWIGDEVRPATTQTLADKLPLPPPVEVTERQLSAAGSEGKSAAPDSILPDDAARLARLELIRYHRYLIHQQPVIVDPDVLEFTSPQ